MAAQDTPATAGTRLRIHLLRTECPSDNAKEIMWRSTMSQTFHVSGRFGVLALVEQ